jgi:hypothetical protein
VVARTVELCDVRGPDEERVVHFAVQTDRELHRDRMSSPGVQDDLRGMIESLVGHPVRIRVTLGRPDEAAPGPEAVPAPPKGAEPGPGVRKVLDRFDGKIVRVDERPGSGTGRPDS